MVNEGRRRTNKYGVTTFLPDELNIEVQRLADEEMIPKASWIKRSLFNEVNRLRKLRGESSFRLSSTPPRKGRTKKVTE